MPPVAKILPMRVAYEHVRPISSNEIARQITESYVEDKIANTDPTELKTIEKMVTTEKPPYTMTFLEAIPTLTKRKSSDQ